MADEAQILEAVEIARTSGKIRKGANEVTKAIEKGDAKLVVYASDVSPKEVIMHLPLLCKEKNIACFEISKREDLGAAAGLPVATAAVAVVKEGDAKNAIAGLRSEVQSDAKEAAPVKEAPKAEEKPAEEEKPEAEAKEEAPAEETPTEEPATEEASEAEEKQK